MTEQQQRRMAGSCPHDDLLPELRPLGHGSGQWDESFSQRRRCMSTELQGGPEGWARSPVVMCLSLEKGRSRKSAFFLLNFTNTK